MIKSHHELANHIAGRSVLHLLSLGKDSVVCLEWLSKFARPARIVSMYCRPIAYHPDDDKYLAYLKKRYPNVEFLIGENTFELSHLALGHFQNPIKTMTEFNHWEYIQFDMSEYVEAVRQRLGLDFICIGMSKYESVTRATNFYKRGLMQDQKIYPIGLLTKDQIIQIIKSSGLRLHPCYKISASTFDRPSFYKMRAAFIANPEFKKRMFKLFPLLVLDKYRYTKLLGLK